MSSEGDTSYLELSERAVQDRAVESLRATLGEEELCLHWQAGSELTSDEAVAEAEASVAAVSREPTRR